MMELIMMKAIVNVNRSWAIGRGGDLLVYIPEDMKFFRKMTAGAVVVMGRKTLESFPGGRPLKNRVNVVLTKDEARIPQASKEAADEYIASSGLTGALAGDLRERFFAMLSRRADRAAAGKDPGTVLVSIPSEDVLQEILCDASRDTGGQHLMPETYVIGGASIYRKLLPYCDVCLVTINDFVPEEGNEADSWFPNLDAMPDWELAEEGPVQEHEGIHFRFCTYRRRRNETNSI